MQAVRFKDVLTWIALLLTLATFAWSLIEPHIRIYLASLLRSAP